MVLANGSASWSLALRVFSRRLALVLLLLASMGVSIVPARAEQTWTVNFKDADIQELVKFVAEVTERTVVIDPKLRGRVQVMSARPVNREQLYQLFLSILEVNGFTAVTAGDVVRILPLKDARATAGPVADADENGAEIVTRVIQLKNIAAAKLIPVLRPLAPQEAHMAAFVPSNAIIIADSAANIQRIRDVIEKIDTSAVDETDVLRLNHASAEDVVNMLAQLHKKDAAQGQPESQSLTIVADSRTNSVLVSGDEMQRGRVRALVRRLDAPQATNGNARVVYLRYAKAKELAEVLTKVVRNIEQLDEGQNKAKGSGKSSASIEADEGTNSLIITADASVMQSLLAVIDRLDIRRAQVLVEAIIVEMRDINSHDLGIQWLFLDENGAYGSSSPGGDSNFGGALGNAGLGLDGNPPSQDTQSDFIDNLTGVPGQVLGLSRLNRSFSFNVVVNALQKDTDANILSTPTLLTLDNEEASIVVGQNVPFVTGSYTSTGDSSNPQSPFQTIQRENVGITLQVTPHINEGDSLVLEIVQEVSSLTGAASDVNASDVITQERKIETKVLADNGQTIVLGGLIQDDIQEGAQKVPLLGDIPVIGRLFRSNSTKKTKTHLMVFLRPTIMRDSRELAGATGDKYQYIRDQQIAKRERGVEFLDDDELPLLPEWRDQLQQLQDMREQGDGVDLRQESGDGQ